MRFRDGLYVSAKHDYRLDAPASEPRRSAPRGAVLLFDGVFLLRSELAACWDLAIYVAVDLDVALDRAVRRDAMAMGGTDAANLRMPPDTPGQRLYHAEADPAQRADIVVNNTDLVRPRLVRVPRLVRGGRDYDS